MDLLDKQNYTYIKNRSKQFFKKFTEYFKNTTTYPETVQERIGFYYFILSHVTREIDFNVLSDFITDTHFNKLFFPDLQSPDYGIDAIHIDYTEGAEVINLFNFKYRESYTGDGQSEVDLSRSYEFLECIKNRKIRALKHKSKKAYEEIKTLLDNSSSCKINLYYVSNESFPINATHVLDNFRDSYTVDVIPVVISTIADITSLRPRETIDTKIKAHNDSFLKQTIGSAVSYLVTIKVLELARITSNKKNLREIQELGDEHYTELYSSSVDNNILYDNVRGFLGSTEYNKNMEKTLRDEPEYFFMYNNGITVTVDNIVEASQQMSDYTIFSLKNAQIVNGGQTVRSIHSYIKNNNTDPTFNKIKKAYITVRIVNIGTNREKIGRKVAEYTNSQNKILPVDLKSVAEEQFIIEKILRDSNIFFQRKRNIDFDDDISRFTAAITLEKMGQVLYSIIGYPQRATTGKSRIFDKEYASIYQSDKINFDKCPDYVLKYIEIQKHYQNRKLMYSDQKAFYLLYIIYNSYLEKNLGEFVDLFEKAVSNFSYRKQISDARKLLLKDFKNNIDKEFINKQAE